MKESKIEQYFVKECKKLGWLPLKFVSPSMNGVPDRIILMPNGRIFFAELKAPGEKPRPLQRAVHNTIRKYGFSVCIIDSMESADTYIDVFRLLGGEKKHEIQPT